MKKNSLTTAVVAGIAGVAGLASVSNAVNLNPDGLGQVLIYPYYTVNAGNSTLLSVVNTTEEVKAVKVRFLESLNSREVLDFNLYLSPFDVWTAAVVSDASTTGPARLVTQDTSCTAPGPITNEPFRNNFYVGTQQDDGPDELARTRNGHIEMIEMGVVVNNGDTTGPAFPTPEDPANLSGVDNVVEAGSTRRFATWATHVNGTPNNCNAIRAAWSGGIWDTDSGVDMDEPTGGLFGAGSIVDVANGTNLSYNADAIDGFYTIAGEPDILHTDPGSTLPSLSQAQTSTLGDADSIIFDNGALITLNFVTGFPDAVSSVYMHDQIFNEFNSAEGTLAQSEWVVTFPTKRLHIEGATPAERLPFTDNVDDSDPPVSAGGDAADDLVFDPDGSCEPISVVYYDREEGPEAPAPILDFSPPVEGEESVLELCYEANVVSWNQEEEVEAGATAVLGATDTARNINLLTADGEEVTAGWIAMTLGTDANYLLDDPGAAPGTPRNRLFGLPVTGFWAANFVNTAAGPGLLANYSLLSRHRASRETETVLVDALGNITPTGFAAS